MASGQTFQITPASPGADAATESFIPGASTPAESVPVFVFPDGAVAKYMDFPGRLQGYGGGGLTFKIASGASVATGNMVWQAAIRAIPDDTEDLDTTAHTYDYNASAAIAAPSAIGEITEDTITFTNGVDMDSLADGQYFILRLKRDPAHASDTLAGDAYLHFPGVTLMET